MKDFEKLQQSWLSQPVTGPDHTIDARSVQSKWQQHQRKVLINNWKITGGFISALTGIGIIYFLFKDHYHWPFHTSIAIIYTLLIVFLIVTWKSYAFKKDNFETSSLDFISYQLSKLEWQRKTLTTYIWIYNILLWLSLCLYTIEVTKKGSCFFTAIALILITAYVVGLYIWTRYYKQKKQLQEINEMNVYLIDLRNQITNA